jgi:hypothetical protein
MNLMFDKKSNVLRIKLYKELDSMLLSDPEKSEDNKCHQNRRGLTKSNQTLSGD